MIIYVGANHMLHDDYSFFTKTLGSVKSLLICDLILENRSSRHIWYFEKNDFKYSSHCSSLVLDSSHTRYTV